MSSFALRYPYFIVVCCLIISVVGISCLMRMPVDLFPPIKIPVVVVATFFSGMPAEQVETDITGRFERFFTLGSGIDHIESKSLPGTSLIKIYFQPGTDADAAVTEISNLAMADLRKLPPGTLPPVVLKFDASSLPVCLITLKADGLSEAQLRDMGQYNVRNQIANIPGASVPQPFGGKYRQIMVYVDPAKLEAYQLSTMDVVRAVNDANLILPSGDAKIGPYDYNLFTNSQIDDIADINTVPIKTIGASSVLIGDIGQAKDSSQIQSTIVQIDGQPSVYLPVMKQGGDANTISIVDGVREAVSHLTDVPKNLIAKVVFDQSVFVKNAIHNLIDEGLTGMLLTGIMILLFLGSFRATAGVFLSIPLSALATFIVLYMEDATVNAMILGGLALAFSRLIDNSVVVLENIYTHLEKGEPAALAAEKGGKEVSLPVLAATLTTAIVFFPVTFLYGVSKYLFSALAIAVVLALFASYVVAMTVMPLFCAKYLRHVGHHVGQAEKSAESFEQVSFGKRFNLWFNRQFEALLTAYDHWVAKVLRHPVFSLTALLGLCAALMLVSPEIGVAYFPRTDPGQFVVNVKAPTGTRLENTANDIKKVEDIIRRIVDPADLDVIASNIGVTPGFSSIYTSNSGSHNAFVQVSLKEKHKTGSYIYMDRVRKAVGEELPQLVTYFQTGGLVDAVLNMGLPAPIDIQVTGNNLDKSYATALDLARQIRALPGVSDVYIPQDIDAPSLYLDVNRQHASEMGLTQKEVVDNIITALTSNQMIAPSYWVDPKSGNDYMLTVQYPENTINTLDDLKAIPVRSALQHDTARLDTVTDIKSVLAPTVINHYQLKRIIDIYVSPKSEDLGVVAKQVSDIISKTTIPENMKVITRGSVEAMHTSFTSFGLGLLLSVLLIYLVLVAQFESFIDPFIILLAVPPGIAGAAVILFLTGTTLNVMSLMGIVMMVGIVVSNSILIVDFAHRLRNTGRSVSQAVVLSCRVRLRPILMTSLATIIGLIPMAMALGAGSEAYASLARVIIGGLSLSVLLTVFIVPAAYLLVYRDGPMEAEVS
jgi:HAE1 family hydrophobic/amphiphilic exporter-1